MADTIVELIESRTYLLEFQKAQLLIDLKAVPSDDKRMEEIIDAIFYKLFGKGWHDLTPMERQNIIDTWKGD